MRLTEPIFHLTPAAYYGNQPIDQPYLPATFAEEGFIHCTAGVERLLQVANHYFANLSDELLVLEINPTQLTARLVFELPILQYAHELGQPAYAADPTTVFPHLYGPLDRRAIIRCLALQRDAAGRWCMPPDNE